MSVCLQTHEAGSYKQSGILFIVIRDNIFSPQHKLAELKRSELQVESGRATRTKWGNFSQNEAKWTGKFEILAAIKVMLDKSTTPRVV